jgi:hypothetical protein
MDRNTALQLMEHLTRDADRICTAFGLRYAALEAERANVKRRYGICYSDGTIKIRLRHVSTGEPLKYSSLVSTLCHELAHLRHFNHGARFQAFYVKLLEWARREGIYRPGRAARVPRPERAPKAPPRPPTHTRPNRSITGPVQLDLF